MSKSKLYIVFAFLLVVVSIIQVFAEYKQDEFLLLCVKPTLMPLVFVLYILKSIKLSIIYILALFLNWIANILFIFQSDYFLLIAAIVFIISRIFILLKVKNEIKLPSIFPFVIGSIPFLFIFIFFLYLIYEDLSVIALIITVFQVIVISLFGGVALGNYTMNNDKLSVLLLSSSIFSALNMLFLGVKFYYLDLYFLKSLAMVFFILGHVSLLYFILLSEKFKQNKI